MLQTNNVQEPIEGGGVRIRKYKPWMSLSVKTERLYELERVFYEDMTRPKTQSFNNWMDNRYLDIIEEYDRKKKST